MITEEEIETIIRTAIPGAVAGAVDLTGTRDHWEVRVSCEGFRGKSLVEQHRMVNQALKAPLEDGRIHALAIKTKVPA